MITPKQAFNIAKKYLADKNRVYLSISEEKIFFKEKQVILFGKYEGEQKDIYSVSYEEEGYQYPTLYFVFVEAQTGEVLCTMSPHGFVEERNDE